MKGGGCVGEKRGEEVSDRDKWECVGGRLDGVADEGGRGVDGDGYV